MTAPRHSFPVGWFSLLMVLDVGVLLVEKTASLRSTGEGLTLLISYLSQPWVWLIFAIKLTQLRTWTIILSRTELSLAFPLTALAIPLTMAAAVVVFGEHPGLTVWIGGALITVGAMVMEPNGSHTESHPTDETMGQKPIDQMSQQA